MGEALGCPESHGEEIQDSRQVMQPSIFAYVLHLSQAQGDEFETMGHDRLSAFIARQASPAQMIGKMELLQCS
jgi:hypothetical protein